jgi:hypothetical protein
MVIAHNLGIGGHSLYFLQLPYKDRSANDTFLGKHNSATDVLLASDVFRTTLGVSTDRNPPHHFLCSV